MASMGTRLATAMAVAAFLALMGATAGAACVPASKKLAAPLVCPKDYDRAIVVRFESNDIQGSHVWSDMWCAFPDRDRFPERMSALEPLAALFAEYLVVASILALLMAVATAPRRSS